jgi:hypothetical protein
MSDFTTATYNRQRSEYTFGVELPDFEELCAAAESVGGLLEMRVEKLTTEESIMPGLNTAFGAGLVVAALVAAGKKDVALAWLREGKVPLTPPTAEEEARMKAITLHEPWASAMADGLKSIETRGWGTDYRGPVAIHAGKKLVDWFEAPRVAMQHYKPREFPYGCVVAIGELVDCQKMTPIFLATVSPSEKEWGWYEEDRLTSSKSSSFSQTKKGADEVAWSLGSYQPSYLGGLRTLGFLLPGKRVYTLTSGTVQTFK